MLMKRNVVVKVVVTETFKRELIERLRQAPEQVVQSPELLDIQKSKYLAELEKKDTVKAEAFRQTLDSQEARFQQAMKSNLAAQLATAEKLEIGTEYHQGTLEGLVEIRPGDMLQDKIHGAEIVIKDGCVVEIRND